MKGELSLLLKGTELIEENLDFRFENSSSDFSLCIYLEENENIVKKLNNKKELLESAEIYKDYCEFEECDDQVKKINQVEENIDKIWDSTEYIDLLFGDGIDINKFIKSNPELLTKKIVLPNYINLNDYSVVDELVEKFGEFKDNIYVHLSNNILPVKLVDCNKLMNTIRIQADEIKKLNLSPIETIMYTYDQVRNRVYTSENKDESFSISRDLNSVLFGDKIVCVGYSNIFNALLTAMGFINLMVSLSDLDKENSGHERNVIYIQDKKYDIDGVYYFDTTWDSKRKDEINEFLYRYKYFAKTRNEIESIQSYNFKDDRCPYYSNTMVKDLKNLLDKDKLSEINTKYATSLNYMSAIVFGRPLIDRETLFEFLPKYNQFDRDELLNNLNIIQEKFNQPISAEKLIRVLNEVRKVEYYQDSEFYPYEIDDLFKTYWISNWNFAKHHYNPDEKFTLSLFGEESLEGRNHRKSDFITYINQSEIIKNVEQVRVTKVLQKIYQNKSNK